MSNLVPERWREALERVHDKIGGYLSTLVPRKKQEQLPEGITADTIPAFMQMGGPLLDLRQTEDELVVRVELPGLKKEDFSVEVVGSQLTIRGEKKVTREEKGANGYLLSECRYGSFARSVQLPCPIDEKKMAADLKSGVLTIRLPKLEKERHHAYRIPVS